MSTCYGVRAVSLDCEILSAKRLRGVSGTAVDFDVWRTHTYALAEVYGLWMIESFR